MFFSKVYINVSLDKKVPENEAYALNKGIVINTSNINLHYIIAIAFKYFFYLKNYSKNKICISQLVSLKSLNNH